MSESIHLYFHSPCFDGAASAAIASTFLEQVKGYPEVCLHGVNYHLKNLWLAQPLERPCAVVDFLYHPDAEFWFDHHPTAFLLEELRRDYEERSGQDVFYDSQATSCALLIWRRWSPALPKMSAHFEPLVYWADRIDSARYESVQEAISFQSPALQINLALGTSRDPLFSQRLVHSFREASLEKVAALPEIRTEFEKGWKLQQLGLDRLKQQQNIGALRLTDNGIVVFDVNGDEVLVNRYAPFHFYPRARYSAGIVRTGGKAKITAMRNPWIEFPSAPLGELCVPLGGGGHQRVGSILVRDPNPQATLDRLLEAISNWEGRALAEVTT